MSVIENLNTLKLELDSLARLYQTSTPRLVIVTKYQEIGKIEESLDSGHRVFAENIVQDAMVKWPELKVKYQNVELQMIGHLQSNKVKSAVEIFDVIASVDSLKLARKIKEESLRQEKEVRIYLQVNVSEEKQKSGFSLGEIDQAIKTIREEVGLNVEALMCVPMQGENPTPYFAILKEIAKRNQIAHCSMGMSSDYEKAIAACTNEVRIGSLVFREENLSKK